MKGLLFLLICCGIMAIVVYSPLFTLQRVNVHGNTYLTQDDIMTIGRMHIGQPLFQLETDAVTQNLMHDLRIESAVVRRRVPDSLDIDVVERMPVATVAGDYGYMDLDRLGKVIACYRSLRNMPIPLITGVSMHDLYIGDDNQNEVVAQVLDFLQKLDTLMPSLQSSPVGSFGAPICCCIRLFKKTDSPHIFFMKTFQTIRRICYCPAY